MSAVASLILLSACAGPQTKYDWGNYEQSMYKYYQSPESMDGLLQELATTIQKSEAASRTVAPGLYAEYGYLLMRGGNHQLAIANFDKEKQHWPESTVLMDRMTKIAHAQTADIGKKE